MRWKAIFLCLGLVGCATPNPAAQVAGRFRDRVPFERGEYESSGRDTIEVTELWGTRPSIEVGGEYVVAGRYTLASADRGVVWFFLTANNWDNGGPVMDLQQLEVKRGSGTFVLQSKIEGPGWPHVILHGEGRDLADLYFGEGQFLRVEQTAGAR